MTPIDPEPLTISTAAGPPIADPAELHAAATAYVAAGISVIPISPDGSKQPAWRLLPEVLDSAGIPRHPWKPYQRRLPTTEELAQWFRGFGRFSGIAAIAGTVSGQLEILDFDSYEIVEPWIAAVRSENAALFDRLVVVRTPRPGLHVYYRCADAANNQILAQRAVQDSETGLDRLVTLIETRGEGGYALVPPTPGRCHPTGRPYEYGGPLTLTTVPILTAEERRLLIGAARSLSEVVVPQPQPERVTNSRLLDPRRPGDDFELRKSWQTLLEQHGWSYVSTGASGIEHWCRPGKSGATSATLNHAGVNLLHVFTSNADGLETNRSYTKLAFFVAVVFKGDFRAAIQDLKRQGYGAQTGSASSARRFLSRTRHERRK